MADGIKMTDKEVSRMEKLISLAKDWGKATGSANFQVKPGSVTHAMLSYLAVYWDVDDFEREAGRQMKGWIEERATLAALQTKLYALDSENLTEDIAKPIIKMLAESGFDPKNPVAAVKAPSQVLLDQALKALENIAGQVHGITMDMNEEALRRFAEETLDNLKALNA